jgi:hypothetical protein
VDWSESDLLLGGGGVGILHLATEAEHTVQIYNFEGLKRKTYSAATECILLGL